ncbi:hypothetical protein ACIQU5_36245 [Streptomyces sp. NPDC090306]|uniref:hypothetical protein n=1 Tax=Streptomyces sp. NPDC090306 TaxID=3365961 RepID=UPI0037F4474D
MIFFFGWEGDADLVAVARLVGESPTGLGGVEVVLAAVPSRVATSVGRREKGIPEDPKTLGVGPPAVGELDADGVELAERFEPWCRDVLVRPGRLALRKRVLIAN